MGNSNSTQDEIIGAIDDAFIEFESQKANPHSTNKVLEKLWHRVAEDGEFLAKERAAALLKDLVFRAQARKAIKLRRRKKLGDHTGDNVEKKKIGHSKSEKVISSMDSPKTRELNGRRLRRRTRSFGGNFVIPPKISNGPGIIENGRTHEDGDNTIMSLAFHPINSSEKKTSHSSVTQGTLNSDLNSSKSSLPAIRSEQTTPQVSPRASPHMASRPASPMWTNRGIIPNNPRNKRINISLSAKLMRTKPYINGDSGSLLQTNSPEDAKSRPGTGSIRDLNEAILRFLDRIDKGDGYIKRLDFLVWAKLAMADPEGTIYGEPQISSVRFVKKKEIPAKDKKLGDTSLQISESLDRPESNSRIMLSASKWVSSSELPDDDDADDDADDEGTVMSELSDTQRSIAVFEHDMKRTRDDRLMMEKYVFSRTPIYVRTRFGLGIIREGESRREGTLKVEFHHGTAAKKTLNPNCVAYFKRDWKGNYPGIKEQFTRITPNLYDEDVESEIRLYNCVCKRILSEGDIQKMTDRQIILLLPILLQKSSKVLRKRIKGNTTILRLAFWIHRSMPTTCHLSNIRLVNVGAPQTQVLDTVNFFHKNGEFTSVKYGDIGHPLQILCPLYPERTVTSIRVIKKFSSGHAPTLLGIKLSGLNSFEGKVIFKPDEIRTDMMVMRMFEVFNVIWRSVPMKQKLTPYAYTFKICAISKNAGLMEFVANATESLNWPAEEKINLMDHATLDEFVRSAAGSYVACYILGCRDRHKSNFMIKDDRIFLQIDFKHCFGRKTRYVDSPDFAVKTKMRRALRKRRRWKQFVGLCVEAFKALRDESNHLIKLCRLMFNGLVEDNKIAPWMKKAFRDGETEEQAVRAIPVLIEKGVHSISRKIKDAIHIQAAKRRQNRNSRSRANSGWWPSTPRSITPSPVSRHSRSPAASRPLTPQPFLRNRNMISTSKKKKLITHRRVQSLDIGKKQMIKGEVNEILSSVKSVATKDRHSRQSKRRSSYFKRRDSSVMEYFRNLYKCWSRPKEDSQDEEPMPEPPPMPTSTSQAALDIGLVQILPKEQKSQSSLSPRSLLRFKSRSPRASDNRKSGSLNESNEKIEWNRSRGSSRSSVYASGRSSPQPLYTSNPRLNIPKSLGFNRNTHVAKTVGSCNEVENKPSDGSKNYRSNTAPLKPLVRSGNSPSFILRPKSDSKPFVQLNLDSMSDLHSFQDDIYRRRGHSVAVNNEIYDESSDSDLTRAEDSKARMRRMKKDLQGSLRQWYPIDKADLSPDSDTLADMTPSDMLLATKSNTFKRKKRRNRIMPFALDDDDDVSVTNTATFDKNSDYKDTFSETGTLNSTFLEESWIFTAKDLTEASAEDPVAHSPPKAVRRRPRVLSEFKKKKYASVD